MTWGSHLAFHTFIYIPQGALYDKGTEDLDRIVLISTITSISAKKQLQ